LCLMQPAGAARRFAHQSKLTPPLGPPSPPFLFQKSFLSDQRYAPSRRRRRRVSAGSSLGDVAFQFFLLLSLATRNLSMFHSNDPFSRPVRTGADARSWHPVLAVPLLEGTSPFSLPPTPLLSLFWSHPAANWGRTPAAPIVVPIAPQAAGRTSLFQAVWRGFSLRVCVSASSRASSKPSPGRLGTFLKFHPCRVRARRAPASQRQLVSWRLMKAATRFLWVPIPPATLRALFPPSFSYFFVCVRVLT